MRRKCGLVMLLALGDVAMAVAALQASPPSGPTAAALNATKIEKVWKF